MDDVTTPGIPPLYRSVIRAIAQKALTALATAAVGAGALSKDHTSAAVSIGVGLVMWGASFVWTYVQERKTRNDKTALLNAPPPVAK